MSQARGLASKPVPDNVFNDDASCIGNAILQLGYLGYGPDLSIEPMSPSSGGPLTTVAHQT